MKKVKPDTIIRTIILIIALTNQALAIMGKEAIPVTDDQVYQLVTLVITIIASLWTWWKNNSFTLPAIKADEYLEKLRREKK